LGVNQNEISATDERSWHNLQQRVFACEEDALYRHERGQKGKEEKRGAAMGDMLREQMLHLINTSCDHHQVQSIQIRTVVSELSGRCWLQGQQAINLHLI